MRRIAQILPAPILFPLLFPGLIVLLIWAMSEYHESWIVAIVAILLGVYGAFSFIYANILLGMNWRFFPKEEMRLHIRALAPYRFFSDNPVDKTGPWYLVAGVIILFQSLMFQSWWASISFYLLGNYYWNSMRRMLPPFVLLLGTSGDEARNLAGDIAPAIAPLQMTELLSVEFNRTWDDALVKATKTRINNPAIS